MKVDKLTIAIWYCRLNAHELPFTAAEKWTEEEREGAFKMLDEILEFEEWNRVWKEMFLKSKKRKFLFPTVQYR